MSHLDEKAHKRIDPVLADKKRHSNIDVVQSFRGAYYDTDHYLMDGKLIHRLSESKGASQKFHTERLTQKPK
jgi:hypothetical protein